MLGRLKLTLACVTWVSTIITGGFAHPQTNDLLGIGHFVIQLSSQLKQSWGEGKQYLHIVHFAFRSYNYSFTDSIFVTIFDDFHRPIVNRERMLDDGRHWDLMPQDSVFGFIHRTDRIFTLEREIHILHPDSFGMIIRSYGVPYIDGPPVPSLEYPIKGTSIATPQVKFQWSPVVNDVDNGGIIIWNTEPTVESVSENIIYRQKVEVSGGNLTVDLSQLNLEKGREYYWALWYFRDLRFLDGKPHFPDYARFPGYSIEVASFSVGTNDLTNGPKEFKLLQNYPNPFNRQTAIEWYQSHAGIAQLRVYNVLGQRIKELTNRFSEAGVHLKLWDGTNERGERVPAGSYFIVGESMNQRAVSKVILSN